MRKNLHIVEDKRDFREGFEFNGRWWTLDEVKATCEKRMKAFDQLSKNVRDRINERGQ